MLLYEHIAFYFYLTKFVCSLYFVFICILKPVTLFLHFFLLLFFLDKTLDKPKSGTLKSPPKGFDTTIINKTYYNVVSITILRNSVCVCLLTYIVPMDGFLKCVGFCGLLQSVLFHTSI